MSKPTYWELLKHPKWQEKRLLIMQRAGFRCEQCDTNEVTLNVHHTYYEKGKAPWEYPDESLHCLCEPCHEEADGLRLALLREIGQLTSSQAWEALGYMRALQMEVDGEVQCEADNYEVLHGMVRLFLSLSGHQTNQPVNELIALIRREDRKALVAGDLFDACRCDELAESAKGVPFELVP